MHFKSLLTSTTLFLVSSPSIVHAAPESARGVHHIVARSSHLSHRQIADAYEECMAVCDSLDTKLIACGNSDACVCASDMSVPFHDCVKCNYDNTNVVSLRADIVDSYKDYLAACKTSGHPVQGNTAITESDNLQVSLSSVAAASTSAPAAASATTSSSSKSASNSASGFRSYTALGWGVSVVAVAAFAFL
ncbi:hypothetical protein FRB90_001685 [Tulasnella sp. 427]|nr:hypothetical protein FRB90_001685 [Tulasnella sp. 427]